MKEDVRKNFKVKVDNLKTKVNVFLKKRPVLHKSHKDEVLAMCSTLYSESLYSRNADECELLEPISRLLLSMEVDLQKIGAWEGVQMNILIFQKRLRDLQELRGEYYPNNNRGA
jgi:hypothetical protein